MKNDIVRKLKVKNDDMSFGQAFVLLVLAFVIVYFLMAIGN